jgi:hypothetical protein
MQRIVVVTMSSKTGGKYFREQVADALHVERQVIAGWQGAGAVGAKCG